MRSMSLSPFILALAAALPSKLPLADISVREAESLDAMATVNKRSAEFTSLHARALGDMTQNDVVNGVCKPMTVLFARGTTELGNMGTIIGPPLAQAIGQMVGEDNVAVQGVDYPADVQGFLAGGDAGGSQTMAQLVGQVMAACPQTKLVMAGYSQGGQVVHNAADQLSADESAFVNSAVIFGDPNNGQAVGNVAASQTKVFCNNGDAICDGQALVLPPHLAYGRDANEAAQFVAQVAGMA